MRTDAADHAKDALDIYAGEMGPRYREALEHLSGALAMNQLLLGSLELQAEHAHANQALVEALVASLSQAEVTSAWDNEVPHSARFLVPDAHTARLVESTVIWQRVVSYSQGTGHYTDWLPFFIAGRYQFEPPKHKQSWNTRLLLVPAAPLNLLPITDLSRTNEVDVAEALMHERLFDEQYTDDEIKARFSIKESSLTVESSTPKSVRTSGVNTPMGHYPPRKAKKARNRAPEKRTLVVAAYGNRVVDEGISDQMFADYNIADYLNRLATIFGKTDELRELFDKHSFDKKDPIEAIVEE